ncbi:hypothetical protein Tco_1558048, partial [Tanacetum coccineum]
LTLSISFLVRFRGRLYEVKCYRDPTVNLNDPFTTVASISSTPPINTRTFFNICSVVPLSPNQNGSEQVGNEQAMNDIPPSYANKLNHTSLTKANLRKLETNVPNDADYDVWFPLALVHEVNDRMNNSIYGYFIGKRLAFPVVEWFVHNNWEKYGLRK